MNPRRMAVEMWPTLVFGGGLVVLVVSLGTVDTARAVRVVDRLAPSLAANVKAVVVLPQPAAAVAPIVGSADVATAAELLAEVAVAPAAAATEQQSVVVAALPDRLPEPTAMDAPVVSNTDVATAAVLLAEVAVAPAAAATEQKSVVVAALTDPLEVLLQDLPPVQAAAAGSVDPLPQAPPPQGDAAAVPGRIEIVGECLMAEACIDQFLWALYERTPKQDTSKEVEHRKVKVKKKGKMVTVTRSYTRLVHNDFTWKDPKAAERLGMPMIDYVIGGMEKSFKMKLFYMLYAAENAGLSPGITSAFRDDYRQSIASGLKAASDRSYHGGSFRGGYGHGLAADIVSTKGETKAQRWVSTEALWKWVDENGKDYGIGRPYLDRDPPHVGPIDGQEYISRRGVVTKTAGAADEKKAADVKKRDKQATKDKPAAKRPVAAKSSKAKSS